MIQVTYTIKTILTTFTETLDVPSDTDIAVIRSMLNELIVEVLSDQYSVKDILLIKDI